MNTCHRFGKGCENEMKVFLCLTGILCLALVTSTDARTWYITPDGTGDAPTIQAGIDSAVTGDTLTLADGTYTGDGNWGIDYGGKTIALVSESGDPELCIVEIEGSHRGFDFHSGEGPGAVLSGVTVRYGSMIGGGAGGGIRCDSCSPTISNVVLHLNIATGGGGMVCEGGASPTLENVVFRENWASGYSGGGLWCKGASHPTLTNVTFVNNDAGYLMLGGGMSCTEGSEPFLQDVAFIENYGDMGGGGLYCENSAPTLEDVLFCGNMSVGASPSSPSGGGMLCVGSSPSLSYCVFVDNCAMTAGGGFACRESCSPTLASVTFYANAADFGGGLYLENSSPTLTRVLVAGSIGGQAVYCYGTSAPLLTCCNIFGNGEGDWVGCLEDQFGINGNISADPLFCDTASGNLNIEDCSPCLPGHHPDGHTCYGIIGARGIGCECGSITQPKSWGSIKAIYR